MQVKTANNPPITLGLEMSNPSAARAPDDESTHAVAVWSRSGQTHNLLGSAPMPRGARGSDGVMQSVASLCAGCGVQPADIERVIVSVGPGGYTALRIATTTAKMLASTLRAQLVAVPSALVAAQAIGPESRPALIALASKKDHTFASVFDAGGCWSQLGIITADGIEASGARSIVADSHLPESFTQRAGTLGISVIPIHLDARHLLAASAGIDPVDPAMLTPLYAREPDAVTQWRARSSG